MVHSSSLTMLHRHFGHLTNSTMRDTGFPYLVCGMRICRAACGCSRGRHGAWWCERQRGSVSHAKRIDLVA